MVEVRLLYPPDKIEAATRLAEAIESAGYRVERDALPDKGAFPDLRSDAGKARALLLIWSRGLVSAAMDSGRLAEARRHANLVEISADGIEPVAGPEGSPVVLLCGWRGQPFHPGWQRILADIKRHCGAGDASRKSKREAASAPGLAAGDAIRRAGGGRPTVRAAVAAGALIAATLGAGAAFWGNAPDAAAPVRTQYAMADTGPSAATGVGTKAAAASAPVEPAGPVSADAALPAEPQPPAATPAQSESAQARPTTRTASRKAVARQRSVSKRLAAASAPEVKRYSRKHSKTMRRFCQRSGRSTPQCRTFARSTRNLGG